MHCPPLPENEAERLVALRGTGQLDSVTDEAFNDLIGIAAAICQVPMAMVSLVDAERQWLKARIGIGVQETARDISFCAHAILNPAETMVVEDALLDPRFQTSPLVTGEAGIRFYAGAPLLNPEGLPLGSFCVMDRKPRELDPEQLKALEALSRQASNLIELRRLSTELQHHLQEREWYEEQLSLHQDELVKQNADLTEMSRTDPLTGLDNRRAFSQTLEEIGASGQPYAVAICDIDRFKTINDEHGHAEGDRVLREVAAVLRTRHAARGRVARYGGEEFVMLFPGMDGQGAQVECEQLRQVVADLSLGMPVTISVGVASGVLGVPPERALEQADAALYEAKRGGRNRVVVAAAAAIPSRRLDAG